MSTPINQPQKASTKKRMLAVSIDFFILAIFQALLMAMFFMPGAFGVVFFLISIRSFFFVDAVVLMVLLCTRDIVGGMSIGKRIVKIAVRSSNDSQKQLRPLLSIVRNLTLIIAVVDILVYLLSRDKRRLGDKIAGADVVEV